jgi:hypothetical protein
MQRPAGRGLFGSHGASLNGFRRATYEEIVNGTPKLTWIFKLSADFIPKKKHYVALIGRDWKPLCIELNNWLAFGKDLEKAEKELVNAGGAITLPSPSGD